MTRGDVPAAGRGHGDWFTSSHTNDGGSCVEVRFGVGAVFVRDSKDRRVGRPVIAVTGPGWTSFLDSIRS